MLFKINVGIPAGLPIQTEITAKEFNAEYDLIKNKLLTDNEPLNNCMLQTVNTLISMHHSEKLGSGDKIDYLECIYEDRAWKYRIEVTMINN